MPDVTRREFASFLLQGAGVACASAAGLTAWVKTGRAAPFAPVPPGTDSRFADRCVKCGLCVKACPPGALKLARLGDPAPFGTPYFVPRETPCEMCEDVPCAKVCPSGALDRQLDDIKKARMGIAVVDPSSCLSWQGLRCEVCWRVCPVKNAAISLIPHSREISHHAVFVPTVDPEHCTGCGMCTHSCPTDKPSITIQSRETFLSHIGDHYRLSWKKTQPHNPHIVQPAAPEDAGGLDYLNNGEEP